jgi:hypothetical protein
MSIFSEGGVNTALVILAIKGGGEGLKVILRKVKHLRNGQPMTSPNQSAAR